MKKWTLVLFTAMLMMVIAACGSDNDVEEGAATPPVEETAPPAETSPVEEESQDEVPTAEELLQRSVEASANLKSFAMNADIKQHIVVEGEQSQEQNVDMVLESEITMDPMEMMQIIEMDTAEGKVEMKQYIMEDGIYVEMDNQWMKIPQEQEQEIRDSMDMANAGPDQQLEQFKSIAQDTTVTEEGDVYILTADVSGDNLKEIAKSMMSQAGNDPQMEAMMEQMDIKSVSLVYGVHKETYLPTTTDLDMVLELEAEGEKVTLEMKMKSTYSKYDEIDQIEVPEEALNAQ
ncbi:DUF6612 family protein [Paenibacillus sp. JCM 10914]|uniref:DUF6612 family protein n=1 Tax=Paenibacillus sp. JCM 10914 TaxID=1236974 RepID=UPI00055C7680|nr:DUF6612 family protein [Paenibacillus sp. JCM 10914]